jgi:hypothetical protein
MGKWLAGFVVAGLIPWAAAWPQSAPLTSEEMRAELFGIHMYGIETAANFRWDECIDPSGRTVFRVEVPEGMAPYSENGQLRIEEGGVACFSYPPEGDPEPACFRALRRGEGYAFISTRGDPGVFLTTRIERGKESCPNPGDMIG